MVTFGTLGLWQLNVARDKARSEQVRTAPTRAVADIAAVLTPHGPFPSAGTGRRITATGRYDASGQVLVTSRRLGDQSGYWVVTPLVVRSSGARIAVVRGFVTVPGQAAAPVGAAQVFVSGTLASGESSTAEPSAVEAALPDGQLAALDLSLLVNRWPGSLYNAFIFATAERPDVTSLASPAVQRVPPPALVGSGLSLRNAAYAFQWWVFALFAAYMWWRMVRDDYQDSRQHLQPPLQPQPQRQPQPEPEPEPERASADVGQTRRARNV
jgi:surfeit locus 1 family protein